MPTQQFGAGHIRHTSGSRRSSGIRTPERIQDALSFAARTALAVLATGAIMTGTEFFVATNGNDRDSGSREKPFATLARARDAVRGAGTPAVVTIRGGDYRSTEPVVFSANDSGSPEAPVVYRAHADERVRFTAGIDVTSGLTAVADESVKSRLNPAVRDLVRELDLTALGVKNCAQLPDIFEGGGGLIELFSGGKRLPLARWPNEGYTTMANVVSGSCQDADNAKVPHAFTYRDDRHAAWNIDAGVWLAGFWRVPWTIQTVRVKAVDTSRRTVELASRVPGGIGSKYAAREGSGKEQYFALNVLEEIDAPGEWCIDFRTKKLYILPPGDASPAIISDMKAPFIRVSNAHDIVFQGLTFDTGLGSGIEITDALRITVGTCDLRNLGGYGVRIAGGYSNTVAGCELSFLGEGGVGVSGGVRETLTPCMHRIHNNHIHDFGMVKKTYAPGIDIGTAGLAPKQYPVGVIVTHNSIHDAPHAGILFNGNDHLIEANELYNLALDSHDVGAIYAVLDWTAYGNVIRNNFIHDSPNANGVYLDDGFSAALVYGNIFRGVSVGVFLSGGHDNVATNNIMIDCPKAAVHVDSRGMSRGYTMNNKSFTAKLKAVPYESDLWRTRYPSLIKNLDAPEYPAGNIIDANAAVRCPKAVNVSGKPEHFTRMTIGENVSFDADPGFVSLEKNDLTLKDDADLFRKMPSFVRIPFGSIGPVIDAWRTEIPARKKTSGGTAGDFDSTVDMEASNKK